MKRTVTIVLLSVSDQLITFGQRCKSEIDFVAKDRSLEFMTQSWWL